MTELTIAEKLLYTTVKLNSMKDGVPIGSGTGFFFNFAPEGGMFVPAIFTNKHVINGADSVTAICHLAKGTEPSGQFAPCRMAIEENSCIPHPDPEVDLCAILFGPIIEHARSQGIEIFWPALTMELIPKNEDWKYFDAIEEVLMVGCPRGIYDEFNNLPITRRGHTASSLAKKYNGRNEFMVDMACFPGSSGSPIFLYDRSGYMDRKTNSYNLGTSRLVFVGILYSGPLVRSDGSIVLAQPPKIYVDSMMHLGNAIRSSELNTIDKEVRSKFKILSNSTAKVGD